MRHERIDLVVECFPSPLGTILLACDGDGCLRALDFDDHEARMERLLGRHYGARGYRASPGRVPATVTGALAAFFAGSLEAIDGLTVRTGGTPFQRSVWAALRHIPAGSTTTYGRLGAALGNADACRAVGLANGGNPIGIVVPCHRVIGADAGLTGYGGGIDRKRWLLAHERCWAAPANPGVSA
jgi:methylated-DNA-[protein]-cysteine S-methyltransferase